MAERKPCIVMFDENGSKYIKLIDNADNLTPEIAPKNHLTTESTTYEYAADGKKIYRKSIVVGAKGAGSVIIDTQLTSSYIYNVINISGSYTNAAGINLISGLSPIITTNGLQITVNILSSISRAIIDIDYTKVTE